MPLEPPHADRPSTPLSDVDGVGVAAMPGVGATFAGYRLLEQLGEGASSAVFLARAADSGELVALKIARATLEPADGERLEAALLVDRLSHPNLVAIRGHGVYRRRPYLAMEQCRGAPLSVVAAGSAVAPARLAEILRQLALALAHAHGHGVVHRDVKPSNVMVDDEGGELRVQLLDFGFGALRGATAGAEPLGTLLYMAPEQLGLGPGAADHRGDLYALGMMGIELLAGRHPFADRDLSALIHAHAATVPRCPAGCPPALVEILDALCRKDPERRYQTADGLAADLADLVRRLSRGETAPFALRTRHREQRAVAPRFQGRDDEIAILRRARDDAARGLVVVAVGGLSGMGKSELVRAAADGWGPATLLSARGRAYGQTSAYGLFAQALDDLVSRPVPPATVRRMCDAVGLLGGEVVRLVPALETVLGPPAELAELEPEQRRQRFFGVMARLLAAIGAPESPLVLFFDDAQWADEGSLQLLAELTSADPGLRAAIVLAHRTDPPSREASARALAAAGPQLRRIDLGPLGGAAVRALVDSMLGRAPAEVAELVEARAAGHPLFAAELVRGLVDAGAIVRDGDSWEVRADVLARVGHGTRLGEVIAERLGRLEVGALHLLTVASAVGRTFSADVVGQATRTGAADVARDLDEAERAHLVRPTPGGEREFTHDKVREVLYDGLTAAERADIHGRIGLVLESAGGTSGASRVVFALAYHFARSTEADRAARYAVLAGEASLGAHAHAQALAFFADAAARVGPAPPPGDLRRRLHEGSGDAHRMLGAYDAALERYHAASESPGSQLDAARIAGKIGGVYFSRGDAARAAEALIDALHALGEPFPRSSLGIVWILARELVVQVAHTLRPPRAPVSRDPVKVEVGRIYSRLTYVFYFVGMLRLLAAHLRHLNLLERHNVESELGQAYSNHGPVCATIPLFSRGLAYAERSITLRKRLGDRFGTAQSRSFHTVTLTNAGRFGEAIAQGERARDELQRLGDRWELVTVLSQISLCHARMGAWASAVASIDEIVEHARASNHSAGLAYAAWTRVYLAARTGSAAGIAEIERALPDCERAGDTFSVIQLLHSLGRLRLRTGDTDGAVLALERAVSTMRSRLFRSDFVAVAYPALADAYVQAVERCAVDAPERSALVRRARRAVRWALVHTRFFGNELSYAWRVAGRLARQLGRPVRARRCLDRAHRIALEQGQPHLQALALVELGRMDHADRPLLAKAALRTAVPLLRSLGAREDLAIVAPMLPGEDVYGVGAAAEVGGGARATVDAVQLQDLVVVGRQLSAIRHIEDLLEQILDSAVRLLGAERGILFLTDPDREGALAVRAIRAVSDAEYPACTSIAHKALRGGRTLVLADAQSDDEFHATASVVASGVRSVLCAPMRFQERILGVLYLDNRLIRGVFSESNLRILEFLASQAAVALVNARAFEALADENRERLRSEGEAQAASRAKSAFLANMSHELRTPLNAILGYAELVSDELAALQRDDLVDDLGRVTTSAHQLLRIVEDVLDLSRIEAGKIAFRSEPVAVEPLLAVEVDQVRRIAGDRGDALTLEVAPGTVATADPSRVCQVVANLLSNAVKFTENGAIRVVAGPGADGTVVIAVSDTGVGIPAHALPRIFDRFYQADNGSTRRYSGVGLGLAVCRELVAGMSGDLAVRSEEGAGTTFTLTLPAGPAATG